MKILWGDKDGGPESKSWVWGIEIKGLFSILLLKFGKGSREAFHTHAFNAISWLLRGKLFESFIDYAPPRTHTPSVKPIFTGRETWHMVSGVDEFNWALTFRGPWVDRWREYLPKGKTGGEFVVLTHGRKEVVRFKDVERRARA
jgi:hypothetical protein